MSAGPGEPIGVVCHDAGGANQILAWLEASKCIDVCAYLEGPAKVIWAREYSDRIRLAPSLHGLLPSIRTLITGTGWASDLEHNARMLASDNSIYSIAILDHWTNYKERFVRQGVEVVPNEIWTVDKYANLLATSCFPDTKIELVPDAYLAKQLRVIARHPIEKPGELLYLLEPVRDDWTRGEPGEFQALKYFMERLDKLGIPKDARIRLRPHPSERAEKYSEFLTGVFQNPVEIDTGTLSDAVSRARWVAGCQSYAMVLAMMAGRTVYCSLPPWAPECKLPHTGFIHLRSLDR